MCNIKALSLLVQKLWSRLSFFPKVGQKSRSRSRGKAFCFQQKGPATRNTHVKYESLISFGSKVITKVKFFQKKVKSQGQGHEVKNYGIDRKVLPQEIHKWNMKTWSLLVQKLWPRLSFFKSRSKVKVKVTKSKFLVLTERSSHKEYTWVILKLYLLLLKSYCQG